MNKSIHKAEKVARANITEIYTVQEWADAMGFNCPKYFSRTFRNHFGTRPKESLVELRVEKFFEFINEKPELNCYKIAIEIGIRDEIALSKYIKRYMRKN